MTQSEWKRLLCAVALAAAVPACTVENSDGGLLRVATDDEGDDARFNILHVERVGDRQTWHIQDYFIDGEVTAGIETPTGIDPEGRLRGEHRIDYFKKVVSELDGAVTYASEPTGVPPGRAQGSGPVDNAARARVMGAGARLSLRGLVTETWTRGSGSGGGPVRPAA